MQIDDEDVITFLEGSALVSDSLFFAEDLKSEFRKMIGRVCSHDDAAQKLIAEGLPLRILKPGSQWQNARLKITMEIVSEKTESDLDEFR